MELEVKGHSGCQIEIARESNDLYIYKRSYDKKYLSRLVKQAEKQNTAAQWEYQHIRVPEIYAVEKDAGHVSIKMEYVYSRNFIEYFESAGFEQVDYFIKALILFVEKELKHSPMTSLSPEITMRKFEDVKKKVFANPLLSQDAEVTVLMEKCEQVFTEFVMRGRTYIPVGECHGDLTFSNILFNGNNYYLIDFLDSFIESPLLDIVKIRQDSAHLWSQLMYTKHFDELRLKIICDKIDQEIDGYFSRYAWYRDYYATYQLMNLLRILQYAKEEKVVEYLKINISNLLGGENSSIAESKLSVTIPVSNTFSLIVPAAADNESEPDKMPYIFNIDDKGVMLCLKSIMGLNLEAFDRIYFSILRKHADMFNVNDMLQMQFNRMGLDNADIVILETPTSSQAETIYRTIAQKGIGGGVFVKDADGYFECQVRKENSIAIYPLEAMPLVDPQHKSYVAVDDMYCVTNVIEKRIISHYFNAGGSCFESAADFCSTYEELQKKYPHVCISHVIYQLLLMKYKYRPLEVKHYKDWGRRDMLYINGNQ